MIKLVQRGARVAASPIALSIALLVMLALPASGLAAPGPEGTGTLKVSPSPIVLPTTTVGNQSNPVNVQIGYEGEGEVSIEKVVLDTAEPGEFFYNGSNCGNLFEGQGCEASVGLKPNSAGEKHATLVVEFAGERPDESFEVSGKGAAPQFSFTPGSYDFGLIQVNNSNTTSFQLTNTGEASVQFGNFEIVGSGQNSFWTGSSNCWGSWLEPGQSCYIEVGFNPRDAIAYEAELRTNENGSSFGANLSGFGGRAAVEPATNPVDFGSVTAGSLGPIQTIVLTNNGNYPGNFFIAVIAGGDSGSFRLLDENCSANPVLPTATCIAHVRFTPQSAGPKVARLALFGDSEGGTMVFLTGEGIAPAVTLAPSSFDFGSQQIGTRSDAHSFVVRNEGGTSLDLGGVSIVGADLDQFALAGDECTGATLAPGAECLLRVRFAPDGHGAKAATLRVGSDAGAFTAALSGTGLAPGELAVISKDSASDSVQSAGAGQPPAPRPRRHRRFVRGATISVAGATCRPAHRACTSRASR